MPVGLLRPWRSANDAVEGDTSARAPSFSEEAAARPAPTSVRGAAIVVVVLSFASMIRPAIGVVQNGWELIGADTASRADRELGPSPLSAIDTRTLLLRARETIPEHATYAVVVGDTTPLPAVIHEGAPPLLRYWLLPRRYTTDLHDADWIVTIHASTERLDVAAEREIGLGPDANAVEVAR